MQTVLLKIDRALSLDDENKHSDAYREYLSCIQTITETFQAIDIQQKILPNGLKIEQIPKLVALSKQCLDRAEKIIKQEISKSSTNQTPTASPIVPVTSTPTIKAPNTLSESANTPTVATSQSDPEEILKQPFLKAQQQNELLTITYQQRLAKLQMSQRQSSNPLIQDQIAQLNLAFARQRAENFAIAKEQYSQLLLKQQQQKQQEEHNNNNNNLPPNTNQNNTHSSLKSKLENTIFAHLTKAFQERQELKSTDKQFLTQANQEDSRNLPIFIRQHLEKTLTNPSHPFGKTMIDFVLEWKNSSLEIDTENNSFEGLKDQLKEFSSSLVGFILKHFKELPSIYGKRGLDTEDLEDLIRSVVDNLLFQYIFGNLFELYKQRYASKDLTYSEKFTSFKSVNPIHLGVEEDFWLIPREILDKMDDPFNYVQKNETEDLYYPAISLARQLPSFHSPAAKMNCLLDVSKTICTCVDNFYSSRSKSKSVGADQLLPLISYVIIKANIPYIQSELAFMTDFASDRSMYGEMGYTLVTFQTCLQYIAQFNFEEVKQFHRQRVEEQNQLRLSNEGTSKS